MIESFKVGEKITSFFMVKESDVKQASNGSDFLTMKLSDSTGEINAKRWKVKKEECDYNAGDTVKVAGTIGEYNGAKEITITNIRKTEERDKLDVRKLVKTAPQDPIKMFDYIREKVFNFEDVEYKRIGLMILDRYKDKLLYYPGAAKFHHSEMGGLLWHMKRMFCAGEKMCEVYSMDRELLLTGVVVHDFQKMVEIESNKYGISSGYSFEGKMLGHLVLGVRELDKIAKDISAEKRIMLEHMLISHHYEPEWGSPKKPLFIEAEMLHYLDMIDAKMYDFEEATKDIGEGEFSEKVWSLDNRQVYKHRD